MMFDSYCKTVIKNCARRYWKREAKRSEHEYLVADDQLSIYPTDKEAFAEKYIITCGNVQAIFHCFALFTAVKQLKEKEKTVVVLKYWGGYTDKYNSLTDRFHKAADRVKGIEAECARRKGQRREIETFRDAVLANDQPVIVFSIELWNATIDRMTVNLDGSVKVAFRNGIEITV